MLACEQIWLVFEGTAAAAAVASVSSPAVAHVDPAAAAAARQRDASRLSKPSSGPHYVDDEYDFCHEEVPVMADPFAQFGGVPSQEEADEAARELKATFVQKYVLLSLYLIVMAHSNLPLY